MIPKCKGHKCSGKNPNKVHIPRSVDVIPGDEMPKYPESGDDANEDTDLKKVT